MLEKDRSRRITSVRQVGSTLETIMQSMGSPMAEDLDLKTPILGELPAMPSEQIDEAPLDSPPEQPAATDKTIGQVRPDASAARAYFGARRIPGPNTRAPTRA